MDLIKARQSKKNCSYLYSDEAKHSRLVPNKLFLIDIPLMSPISTKYKKFWREQMKRCMEGFWAEGKWMPGNLYMYVNFCVISLNKDSFSNTKVEARPFLRDLEWEKAYVYAEARGFSGFKDDDEYTCFRAVENYDPEKSFANLPKDVYKKDGTLKEFVPARYYLRQVHTKNLGKPLYQNDASNVIDLEARGGGKSFCAANMLVLHNFLTDGCTDYDEYRDGVEGRGPRYKSETLMGAIDDKYTGDLIEKLEQGISGFQGGRMFQGNQHPSPLMKDFSGSLHSGHRRVVARVDVEIGGRWQKVGSGSMIHRRTFKDNPLAGNGTRPSLSVFEEGIFMNNLHDTLGAMKDTTYNGPNKFGTVYIFGTGGGEEGDTIQAMDVFNNPNQFDCLMFDDIFEETGDIGFFVPYKYTLNDYKDSNGNTEHKKCDLFIANKRQGLKEGKSKKPFYSEMQNNPNTHSEAFLRMASNILPVGEMKEHLGWINSMQHKEEIRGQHGELVWKENSGGELRVEWKQDLNNNLKPCGFKMDKNDDTTGCVHIWEHPVEFGDGIPYGLYIAGCDPYDQDQSVSTASLGSTFIYKTFHTEEGVYEWPVAEYTARPTTVHEHHENVRKLLTYYNAKLLYENERNSLKMHFEHKYSLHLLEKQPDILKATENSKVNRTYGIHMTDLIKDEIEIYLRDWLLKDCGNGMLNLHKIRSAALLEELIYYNRDGNFDRFISFALTILHRLQKHHNKVEEVKKEDEWSEDPWFQSALNGGFF